MHKIGPYGTGMWEVLLVASVAVSALVSKLTLLHDGAPDSFFGCLGGAHDAVVEDIIELIASDDAERTALRHEIEVIEECAEDYAAGNDLGALEKGLEAVSGGVALVALLGAPAPIAAPRAAPPAPTPTASGAGSAAPAPAPPAAGLDSLPPSRRISRLACRCGF